MESILTALQSGVALFGDTSSTLTTLREYALPVVRILAGLAGLVAAGFIVYAGYLYMASSGKPDQMVHAKEILKKAFIGLTIVLAAITLTTVLTSSYATPAADHNATLPSLQAIKEEKQTNGFLDMVVKAVTGLLAQIINAVASPFLGSLDFFTKSTPLMASNATVFNFWIAMVGIANILLIIVLVLIGFHVMSASALGFDELEPKQLVPRVVMIFILMNSSIFLIDGIIKLSNALIKAVGLIGGSASVWDTLTKVVEQTSGLGVAALLIMVGFVLCSIVPLIYYVMRLVTLYIGAVLSPLISLVWLIPGFRDFAETAFKTYLTTIFVLFVHVVILQLSASLFSGMASATGEDKIPDTLIAMVTGIATILLLLKAQGVMMQFSYVSMGSRNIRKLGGQFINGVSYIGGKTRAAARGGAQRVTNVRRSSIIKSREKQTIKSDLYRPTHHNTHQQPVSGATRSSSVVTVTRVPEKIGKPGTATNPIPPLIPSSIMTPPSRSSAKGGKK